MSFIILFKLFKSKISSITISYLDIGFAILFISEIITAFNSSYPFNSISSYIRLSFMLFLYVGCKLFFKDSKKQLLLLGVLVIFSAVLVVFTINDFISFQTKLELAGFSSSINFKHLYTPFGNLINAWSSVLLLFIPLNCLFLWKLRNKKWVFLVYLNLFLICFCILSSFSRGAYISLFAFIFIFNLLVWDQFSLKRILLYNAIVVFFICIAAIPINKDVLTTVSFNATESQQRSTSSRMSDWQNTKELIKDKPILGWGQGNFILAQDKVAFQKEDSVFCPRTQNTYINLLVERGVFGFSCYLVFLGIVFLVLLRNFKSRTISSEDKIIMSLIASGILAILLREFTYASIFEFNSVFFMFYSLLFFLIRYDIPFRTIHLAKLNYSIPSLFLIAIATLLYINISKVLILEQNDNFLKSFYKDDFKSSQVSINKAVELAPYNSSILKNHSLFLLKNSLEIEISEKHPRLLSITFINKDTLQLASKDLKTILKLNPYDDENLHNLAWVYFALGQQKTAQDLLTSAIKLDTYNSTYHISKVLFDLKQENNSEVKIHLVKALRYSPEVLESIFFKELSKKHPKLAKESKQIAISDLYAAIKINNNTILKARLARLLLEENPKKAKQLLQEVTTTLPNLSRPWLYLAYINSLETNDTLKIEKSYQKSLFLNPNDFLLNTYYGNYYMAQDNEKKGLQFFRMSLLSYSAIKSSNYSKNYFFSNIPVSGNSIIPNNLLYYTSPDPQALPIFKAFEKYHQIKHPKYKGFYSKMVKSYSQRIFKHELELP
ncbi:O-antigen ligase family protein [Flavobacterium sp. BBQ-18]|nr:O-antigen ligase family protein [Flavobacterium undicola]